MIMRGGSETRDRARDSGRVITLSFAALLAAGLTGTATLTLSSTAEAKTPGSTYCYYGTCHRVKTIAETESLVGQKEIVSASFYDDCKKDSLNPCGLTSSGEAFRPDRPDNAASPIYPDGTTLLVWSPSSREAAVLRVNNAGPYWGKRKLDVSRAAAEKLGFKPYGVAELQIKVLDAPSAQEATYARYRRYQAVAGPVGKYASLEEARLTLAVMDAFEHMPTTAVLTKAVEVAAAQAGQLTEEALRIDLPENIVLASAADKPVRPVMKTAQKRMEAKVKRVAAKRKSHYARRGGVRRSTIASRRQARANRYAHVRPRGTVSRRVAARSRVGSRSRIVLRQVRTRNPSVRRALKRSYKRVAEAQVDQLNMLSPLASGSRLLRQIPAHGVRGETSPALRTPPRGPVQVV